ncbi:MAG TPA: tetratricopeptide repeat protein [Bryobacteraceae bacterium]|nr:tetratricopeptide repeat protein [Bryobacteraceae bacterium]
MRRQIWALLMTSFAFSQQTPEAKLLEANRLLEEGEYARAEAVYRDLSGGVSHSALTAKSNLCVVLQRQARYDEASGCTRELLAELTATDIGTRRLRVNVLNNYAAQLLRHRDTLPEAEATILEAIATSAVPPSLSRAEIALPHYTLALIRARQDRIGEAAEQFRDVLKVQRKELGPEHPDVAATLNNLGQIEIRRGDYIEAETLVREALQIWTRRLGPYHPHIAVACNNLAQIYRLSGRRAEAEPFYRRAIEALEHTTGPYHPDLAIMLGNFAGYMIDIGRLGAALSLYERALEAQSRSGGNTADLQRKIAGVTAHLRRQTAGVLVNAQAADYPGRSGSVH